MKNEIEKIDEKVSLSHKQWNDLIEKCEDDKLLALAIKIAESEGNSTWVEKVLNYGFPKDTSSKIMPEVQEYALMAKILLFRLAQISNLSEEELYFQAARITDVFNPQNLRIINSVRKHKNGFLGFLNHKR